MEEAPTQKMQAIPYDGKKPKTHKERLDMSVLIFYKHPEILNRDEKSRFYSSLANAAAAHGFVALIQIPLSMLYMYRLIRNPKEFQHLRWRLVALPLISLPWMIYSTHLCTEMSGEMHEKYMSDLSDNEMDNFS